MYTRHVLSGETGSLTFEKEYDGSTENVIKSVLLNKADAGAVFNTELAKEPPEVLGSIRTLIKTRQIPAHPLAAHPRVPASVRAAVKRGILALGKAPGGAQLLKDVRLASPTPADYERDYQDLEDVDVEGLSGWGE